MEKVFKDTEYVNPFQDDILIYGKNKKICTISQWNVTTSKAKQHKTKYKQNKSMNKLKFLGHVISSNKVKPNLEKIRAIVKMQTPASKKELQCILGMTNYLTKFIDQYSMIT